MYKLVAVAGKLRGEEFSLEVGENIIGRDANCTVALAVSGVSKRHLSISVTNDVAYLKDLGSSNGTFVNGKMVKTATIKSGDRITLPDLILQVVEVKEKKVIIRKSSSKEEIEDVDQLEGGEAPVNLVAKLKHIFKYRLMRFVYGINEEYEWRILSAILLILFAFLTISLTIFPVLQDSKSLIENETALRGDMIVDQIARLNARALEQKNLDQVDTSFLDKEAGIVYELFDLEGRIVRPLGKLNEYSSDIFSSKAKDWAAKMGDQNPSDVFRKLLGDGEIGIAKRIMAYDTKVGSFEPVGVIAIRFSPKTLAIVAIKNKTAYVEALATSGLVAFFFFAIIYYLTIRPIEELRFQIEDVLRGKRKSVEAKYLMGEMKPLRNAINSILQRLREALDESSDDEFQEVESDQGYVATLVEFMAGAGMPVMVLDSDKNIQHLNQPAEDLLGIRENVHQGTNIVNAAREQGIAGTIIELCENSSNNHGTHQDGEYELTGYKYKISVNALTGKDGSARAFYISFLKYE